jgi:ApaG protein
LPNTDKLNTLIKVTASPKHELFQEIQGAKLVFSYNIRIENNSDETVQLQRRKWLITDGCVEQREVEGEGVVGETPVLNPGDHFEYQSWCPLANDFGAMEGYYTFAETRTFQTFKVKIHPFLLLPFYQLN